MVAATQELSFLLMWLLLLLFIVVVVVVVVVVVDVVVVVVVGTFEFGVGGLGLVGRGACVRVWGWWVF